MPAGDGTGHHLGPNLALTFITFATNIFLNIALLMALMWVRVRWASACSRCLALPPLMARRHRRAGARSCPSTSRTSPCTTIPAFWRFHRVHHSDPAVDVTTTIRQHPGEGLIRYAFMAAFAIPLGASLGAFAVYRVWSALSGLLEHANIRASARGSTHLLSLVFTWPNMHKVHHSRDARYTDTNYGNIVSWWDRLFFTFTPARHGASIAYGLDGFDDPAAQTTAGLLAMPFRDAEAPGGSVVRARECHAVAFPKRLEVKGGSQSVRGRLRVDGGELPIG